MDSENQATIAVETKQLRKVYPYGKSEVEVLKGIDLSIPAGTFASIMGPSGSGKSTLLYLIGGLDNVTSGSVSIFGKELAQMSDSELSVMRRREMSFIFQFYNLLPTLTVLDNVLMPLVLDKQQLKENRQRAEDLLAGIGLGMHIRQRANELSGGQQQRVAIARALITDPKLILADEPTGNLDSKSGADILELLADINRKDGKTILLVTHSMEASEYAGVHINLRDGEVLRSADR